MSEDAPVIALPVQEVEIADHDGQLILALKTMQGSAAGLMPPDQTALLALRMLHWVGRQPVGEHTVLGDLTMIHDLRFEGGRSDRHIVLTVDLGAATLRFEVQHDQLGAALAQLNFEAGEPLKPN